MLSYRHGYHAGNHADVLKHAVLAFCLAYLGQKPKPFFVVDSHAGAGLYDLSSQMAGRTGEWQQGIARIWQVEAPLLFQPYLTTLSALNPEGTLLDYPGSPEIIRRSLREQDRALFCELHPTDLAALVTGPGIEIRQTDGFKALVKALPPKERRGLVLIDPSYEIKADYDRAADALIAAHRRFATGTFILWYPVVAREQSDTMLARMEASGIRNQYRVELAMTPDTDAHGMTASGLIITNPPWTLSAAIEEALPWLATTLGAEGRSFSEWLVAE